MKVPFNYLPYEFENNDKIFIEWKKLIKSTDFTLGKFMQSFEDNFKNYVSAKYCFGTNNGTDALILSLKAVEIGEGDEVITVCNSFYATAGAISAVGAKIIFVDSDERFQINISKLEEKITNKTKAIIPVHWAGASPDMKKIMEIANKHELHVIEDACMGIGAKLNDKSPGTFGIIGAYSMHPLKSLNVMGDGGMIVTNNDKIADWVKRYRNHGMIDRDNIDFWGVNMRLQPLQAIVANEGLKKLNEVIEERNKNSKKLDKQLKKLYPKIIIPDRYDDHIETFALYMIQCEDRDNLIKYLNEYEIEVKVHYPIPLHLQSPSLKQGYKKGDFPIAENQALKLVSLPVHQYLQVDQIDFMIEKIFDFYV